MLDKHLVKLRVAKIVSLYLFFSVQLVNLRVLLQSEDGQEYRLNPPFRHNLQQALCASDKTPWQVWYSTVQCGAIQCGAITKRVRYVFWDASVQR